jgi:hypothetical protein
VVLNLIKCAGYVAGEGKITKTYILDTKPYGKGEKKDKSKPQGE